jgi:hypothetical protein
MTLNDAIHEVMPIVIDGDKSKPFIISRQHDEWVVQYPYPINANRHYVRDELAAVREKDPFAESYDGFEFEEPGLSETDVLNVVLADRIHREAQLIHERPGMDIKRIHAFAEFCKDYIAEFSDTVKEYLTTVDKPFAALYAMFPFNMTAGYEGRRYDETMTWDVLSYIEQGIDRSYNESLAWDILNHIERRVDGSINIESERAQTLFDGIDEDETVTVLARTGLNGVEIVCAEKREVEYPHTETPYVVYNNSFNNPYGLAQQYDLARFPDYISAMREYMTREFEVLTALEAERESRRLPHRVMTAGDCIPDGMNSGLTGKLIVIRPEVLANEYQSSDYQLKSVRGGFGAQQGARGSAVFCEDLYSGKQSRFERKDVLGVADPERLPEWATARMTLRAALNEPAAARPKWEKKTKESADNEPSILDRMNHAKAAAVKYNAEHGAPDRPKNRGDMEVN